MLDIWPFAFRPLIFNMGILIPGKVVFVLRQGPDVSMQQKHDLWYVASILDISITVNTTRIILWNFLENIPFLLHGTVLKDQVINSFISYFTNICNVFLCDCFSKLSYCGHFSQKFA